MVMVLSDVVLPEDVIAGGVRGKQTRRNTRAENQAGYVTANPITLTTLRQYELGIAPMLVEQWQQIESIYEITDAGAYGFLLEDPKDCYAEDSPLRPWLAGAEVGNAGYGWGVPQYRLARQYAVAGSSRVRYRRVARPNGVPLITRAGAPVGTDADPGDFAIDLDTGVVTFVPDAASNVTSITVGATTQVTLNAALAGMAVGGRLYLDGLTGVDAGLLEDQSHQISSIVGSTYTILVNTTGKAITATGEGLKYPQPTQALQWTGLFYVPVHFASDDIDWTILSSGSPEDRVIEAPSILLLEVRE